jgi:two-component system sensor histidine kinase BaeS
VAAADADVAEDWTLYGDAQRLSQLFRNLLRNTLAYTDRGGELRVTLSRHSGHAHLDFDDTAPGVKAAELPLLFERLYRVDSSRNRATGGAGLGLAIARNIVAAHGGRVTAAPSPLGGLRVHVALPLEDRHVADDAQSHDNAGRPSNTRNGSGGISA